MDIGWIKTLNHITVVYNGTPAVIKKETPRYKKVMELIHNNSKTKLAEYLFPQGAIEKMEDFMVTEDRQIVMKETKEVLSPNLADKVMNAVDTDNTPTMGLFLKNLNKNPNKSSIKQFHAFIQRYHFPITEDGCFLAYKYVDKRGDKLVDSYSGKFDNSVGSVVTMDRKDCDPDPAAACSRGLHVAAYEYAKSCGSGKVIVEVKVNPSDVVSVPDDHNFQKLRVCRYEVLRVGDKEVMDHFIKTKTPKQAVQQEITGSLEAMTGRQIIDYVKAKTGETIKISPKSKKSVLREAQRLIGQGIQGAPSQGNQGTDLEKMSGKEIIGYVLGATGKMITFSPKSKKSVLREAKKLLGK